MCIGCGSCCLPARYRGNWTLPEIRQAIAEGLQQTSLPIAELQPGNVVKISGLGGFWSDAPLLNPQWLAGRMSQEESDDKQTAGQHARGGIRMGCSHGDANCRRDHCHRRLLISTPPACSPLSLSVCLPACLPASGTAPSFAV
jgi:hypothetical protein